MKNKRRHKCVLCQEYFKNNKMSEEHYPAKNTGNIDIVKLDATKMYEDMTNDKLFYDIKARMSEGKSFREASDEYFDEELATSLYPKGRTSRTLCRKCNTFLGRFDEAYKRFFDKDGAEQIIKGFQQKTKLEIIKSIYAKFLSVPECKGYDFDFRQFIIDGESYSGDWRVYCTKRDSSTDLHNLADIETGMLDWDQDGKKIIFELSDEKFIFHLANFVIPETLCGLNLFDIMNKNYKMRSGKDLIEGGIHPMILISKLLSEEDINY
ncbi:hypothetical protein [Floricoccus penangensis]|uniref:hypothetical protein n=1 Tax=Floricoccus penangensis TaxID=1859475 RepID=UPI00203F99E1|nr:hypothetical protein [Floricoccus penangensis]URZ86807.1 hypothetical protein KIW23_06880 [Floricoccus penangensis]